MAELEWQSAQQALMLRTAERYFDAALAAESLRVLRRQQGAVERSLLEARDRFKLGDAPVTDTHEAAARAQAVRAEVLAGLAVIVLRNEKNLGKAGSLCRGFERALAEGATGIITLTSAGDTATTVADTACAGISRSGIRSTVPTGMRRGSAIWLNDCNWGHWRGSASKRRPTAIRVSRPVTVTV